MSEDRDPFPIRTSPIQIHEIAIRQFESLALKGHRHRSRQQLRQDRLQMAIAQQRHGMEVGVDDGHALEKTRDHTRFFAGTGKDRAPAATGSVSGTLRL